MRGISITAIAVALAGCATQPSAPSRSAEAQAELNKLIAGKTAGTPITCLQHYRANDMVRIDESTVAFKQGRRVYVNHLIGACSNLDSSFYALVTRSNGTGLCRGDIAHVQDVSTGTIVGSCAMGDFVPYGPS
jgi:hypothetical protein